MVFYLSYSQTMELCRPSDSHLEHVDFECLFSCLSLRLLLRVFGSLLLERRVIFTAEKLRLVPSVERFIIKPIAQYHETAHLMALLKNEVALHILPPLFM